MMAATATKEVNTNAMKQPNPSTSSKHLTLDDIFLGPDFKSESYSQPRWWEEGSFLYNTRQEEEERERQKEGQKE
jgi:hypothetical protein